MSPNAKYILAALGVIAVVVQAVWPHAAWTPGLVSAITAALGALHLVAGTPEKPADVSGS